MVGFGHFSGGWSVSEPYMPGLEDFVYEMNDARSPNVNPADRLPFAAGWDCDVRPFLGLLFGNTPFLP